MERTPDKPEREHYENMAAITIFPYDERCEHCMEGNALHDYYEHQASIRKSPTRAKGASAMKRRNER